MRWPRVRFSVRRMMVAVAVMAVLITTVRAATRPIPTVTAVGEESDGFIYIWSDGEKTPPWAPPRGLSTNTPLG